jgi:murein DD-endopeptidase MepM/ murein hydrolase activator NlpD
VHYEVHINDTPVNPHKYMRMTLSPVEVASHGD